jgi:hypothetical protein
MRLVREFPTKDWKIQSLNKLLHKLRKTGTTDRRPGSGRPRSVRTNINTITADELLLSQENVPQTHRTIFVKSAVRWVYLNVRRAHNSWWSAAEVPEETSTVANCITRIMRSKQLLQKLLSADVDFIFFTYEKIFTVAPPVNLQNDTIYVPTEVKKCDITASRLLWTRPTFSKSVMVSVVLSKLGCTGLIFVEHGVKVNGAYYRDVQL